MKVVITNNTNMTITVDTVGDNNPDNVFVIGPRVRTNIVFKSKTQLDKVVKTLGSKISIRSLN